MSFSTKYDIVIIGAGIAGINAAYRIQSLLPNHTYVILEARETAGGTWDLFRYPGVRLDSDIHTFGFSWHPCHNDKPMMDGESLFNYLNETTKKYGIDKHILFNHRVRHAAWSSEDNMWGLKATLQDKEIYLSATYVMFATGYFDHNQPLPAQIPGLNGFRGMLIHPQFWPEGLDCSGKRIAVIGSGATAISLVPKLAETASSVTMVQRSPNYILPIPSPGDNGWARFFPAAFSHKVKRLSWLAISLFGYYAFRKCPTAAKEYLLGLARRRLPKHIPIDPHFTPRYNVWDQRLLACPDGDFFESLHRGNVGIETANIRKCTPNSIVLENGKSIEVDLVITATGLKLQFGGGATFAIDGQDCDLSKRFLWNGMMLQGVPNAFFALGYLTSASWTMGVDVTALSACRLINHMAKRNILAAMPPAKGPSDPTLRPVWSLNSTYMVAGGDCLPKAGIVSPWHPRTNYILDYLQARYGSFSDGLEFTRAG
ncbi:hypothetical protein BDV27DRAFT_169559 [Aspergillus caelatus]|uniref:FAD/NAD(P)-binding domain-containing protein n=1 Tax=Aspergillus caelatus TaxID=61420 RepID=A0A5N6ZMV4_9EURO|nr:uncharacterized protein BDV27DRAFT_169559 [Aspergillus caelatus]KAE8358316.1 hypothetical protein BDV27DRAFT_169559 [Aspergillus caelatus]